MIDQQDLWDEAAAQNYDTPGEGMFSDEILGPTVEVLSELAGGGTAVEFALGTGRIAIPLATAKTLGLTGTERELLPTLGTGQGLWRIKDRSFVVQHQLHPAEYALFDTTSRMTDVPRKFRNSEG